MGDGQGTHSPTTGPPKIQPRAKKNDTCAKGKGKADGPSGDSHSAAHTAPVWNVDWTLDPYADDLGDNWAAMIRHVRAAATPGAQPLTYRDSTAVGTVTITTNDGRTLTLYLQANDLYIIGWQSTDVYGNAGPTFQVDEPGTNHDLGAILCPGATTLQRFTSNYNNLENTVGGDNPRRLINRSTLDNAVHGLADFNPDRNDRRGAAGGLLTMATTIAEAARFPQIEESVRRTMEDYTRYDRPDTIGNGEQALITHWGDLSDLAQGRRTLPVSWPGRIVRTAAEAALMLALWRAPADNNKIGPRDETPPVSDPKKPDPAPKPEPEPKPEPAPEPTDPYWCGAPFC